MMGINPFKKLDKVMGFICTYFDAVLFDYSQEDLFDIENVLNAFSSYGEDERTFDLFLNEFKGREEVKGCLFSLSHDGEYSYFDGCRDTPKPLVFTEMDDVTHILYDEYLSMMRA